MRDKNGSGKNLNKQEKEQLKNTLMVMMEDLAEMEARREEKLWCSIAIDCCLAEALGNLSKDDLNKIRSNLQIKSITYR